MAAAMGKDGRITFDDTTTPPAYMDNWTLNGDIGMAEITAYGNSSRAYGHTLRGFTVSAAGTLDKADTKQDAVLDMFASTSTLTAVTLRMYDSTSYWSCSAFPSGFTVNSQVGDKVAVSYNFQVTGNLTYITT